MSIKKSNDLKILEGNPGHRKIEEKKLKADDKILKCPSWLDRESKKMFKLLADKLQKHNMIFDVDINALTAYCHYYTRWRKIELKLEKQLDESMDNLFIPGPRGKKENPLIKISDKCFNKWILLSSKLGLSPLARYKLGIELEFNDNHELSEFEKTLDGVGPGIRW